jgi:hypothetical protein
MTPGRPLLLSRPDGHCSEFMRLRPAAQWRPVVDGVHRPLLALARRLPRLKVIVASEHGPQPPRAR